MAVVEQLEALAPRLATTAAATVDVADEQRRRLDADSLARVAELVAVLRAGRFAAPPPQSPLRIGVDVAKLVIVLRALKDAVYDAVEQASPAATPRQTRLIGDYFAAATEAALQAQSDRLVAMLDALPDSVILTDPDGRFVHLNRSAAENVSGMSGVPSAQLLGRALLDLPVPESVRWQVAHSNERARRGEAVSDEITLAKASGGRWHERLARPLFDADGRVDAIVVATRDIHDRKQAEARLQWLSNLGALAETLDYPAVLDAVARLAVPDLAQWCIMDVVENGTTRRATVAHGDPADAALAQEVRGLPPEERLATEVQLIGDVDADADLAARMPGFRQLTRRLGARSVMVLPFVVLGKPVAVATLVMTAASARRYEAGDLALGQEMARRAVQIIENARLHQQLQASEARFRFTLAHAKITVFETDADLRIRWICDSHLGIDEPQLLGKTTEDFFADDVNERLMELKRRVLATGEGALTEVATSLRGERRHLLINYERVRGGGGITGASIDITEAKKVEEELARELLFRERMMGVLGHDLRNPVSAILGIAGLLQLQDGTSDKAREALQRIEQSARRMSEMIATLLDFTQIRFRGKLPVARAAVDLADVSRAVVDELRAAHPGRELVVSASGEVRGRWDGGRIAQLISNLVANALTHGAPRAPVEVALAIDGEDAILTVENRGATIPPELVEHIFEPFQQGRPELNVSRSRGLGLGLGLFIVRAIAAAHDGVAEVHSADDVTVFTVRLPRSEATV
jgi:PAS domain S-box-containing protein